MSIEDQSARLFGGIPSVRELLNDTSEWHTAWTGFCHSFYRTDNPYTPPEIWEEMSKEYHYYTTGRMVGRIAKVVIITTIAVIAWRLRK